MPYADNNAEIIPVINDMAPRTKHGVPPGTAELSCPKQETKITTKPLNIMERPNIPKRISTASLVLP